MANRLINKFNLTLHPSYKILKNVSNENVSTTGVINIQFKTKNRTFFHSLYVVEDNSCFKGGILLGLDFLTRCKAKINFSKNKYISLFGDKHKIQPSNSLCPQISCIDKLDLSNPNVTIAQTTETVTVPSSSAILIKIKVMDEKYNNQLIVASENKIHPYLMTPRTLAIVKDNLIPITLFNLTDNEITIDPNKIIARIELAVDEQNDQNISIQDNVVSPQKFSMRKHREGDACRVSGNCENIKYTLSNNRDIEHTNCIQSKYYNSESADEEIHSIKDKTNDKDFKQAINDIDLKHLNKNEKNKIINLLYKHRNAIAVNEELGRANFYEHEIYIDKNQPPICSPQYRVPYGARQIIDDHVQKLIRQGVVETSHSPWSSPVILVKKSSSNEFRFCVDFRKINNVIKKDLYPIPRIDDTLENLQGASIFTTLDMKNSFHQIPLAQNSREYTAFRTISGNYQFKSVPQGLNVSSAAFTRACNIAFTDQIGKFMYAYIDDLVVYSKSFDEHLNQLDEILNQIEKCGFKLGINKCTFASSSVKYLGHIVNKNGIQVDPAKTKAISQATRPRNAKQARSFLGTAGYYRKFIKNFAGIAAPLTNLTKKNTRFKWTKECQEAFDILKNKLTTAPVLTYPHRERKYILHTDASENAVGAVLNQYNETTNSEQPIAYYSRKLKDTENKYSISEREALAIFEGVKNFKPYLWLQNFKIVTDHTALKYLLKNKHTVPRIARWALFLSDFDYEIEYKSGKSHFVPDYLSRNASNENEIINAIDVEDVIDVANTDETENQNNATLDAKCIKREQRNDDKINIIIKYLEGKTLGIPKLSANCSIDEFFLEDDILYRLPRLSSKISKISVQTVIPSNLIKAALTHSHDNNIAAHQGFLRTLERARDNFYWRNMARDVKQYVKCCIPCQKRKWQGREIGQLGEFPEVNYPLDRVGVDLIELPQSYAGNKYILTVIDAFTKYVSAYALPNKSTETVTKAMMQFICNNSVPREICSDRGTEFMSDLFRKTCEMLNAKNNFTTAYHPMANGLTEKANGTIKKILSNICNTDKNTWDDQLASAVLAMNTAFQTSINEIPFFLFHGRDARLPFNELINKQPPINYAEEDYKTEVSLRLRKAFTHVKEMTRIAKQRYTHQYNKKATSCKIQEGSIVLLRNETGSSEDGKSWPTKYLGPYRVLQRRKNNFTIKGIYTDFKEQIVHINRLKVAHLLPNNAYPFNNIDNSRLGKNNTGTSQPTTTPTNAQTGNDAEQVKNASTQIQDKQTNDNNSLPRYNLRSRR